MSTYSLRHRLHALIGRFVAIWALSMLAMPGMAIAQTLTNGLEGYWTFDGSGADSSGHGRDVVLEGNAGFGPGLFHQGLVLDGTQGSGAMRPVSDPVFDFTGDFAIQVWVRPNDTSQEHTLIEKFVGGSGPDWTLTFLGGQFYVAGFGPVINTGAGAAGVWHHVILTRSGTNLFRYYDGQLSGVASLAGAFPSSSAPLLIGARNAADGRNFTVNGTINEVAIWSRGLDAADVAALYNHGAGAPLNAPTILHSFTGGTDGASPLGGLASDAGGTLYGTTALGGNPACAPSAAPGLGCGTMFSLAPNGTFTTLGTFAGKNGANPSPEHLVVEGPSLAGTTVNGGTLNLGTLVRGGANGAHARTVWSFSGTDGANPTQLARVDMSGNMFGITLHGGASFTPGNPGYGTLFEWRSNYLYTAHDFSGGSDGALPNALISRQGVTWSGAEVLFGSTGAGGLACTLQAGGCGTVFAMTGPGTTNNLTTLYSFTGADDGGEPILGAVNPSGNLIGVTTSGGQYGHGTLFVLLRQSNATYSYRLLHAFDGTTDGDHPNAPTLTADGDIVGTAAGGGASGFGTIWKWSHTGFTTLYAFTNGTDGGGPNAQLIEDSSSGILYGTATGGGNTQPCVSAANAPISSTGCGVVFRY